MINTSAQTLCLSSSAVFALCYVILAVTTISSVMTIGPITLFLRTILAVSTPRKPCSGWSQRSSRSCRWAGYWSDGSLLLWYSHYGCAHSPDNLYLQSLSQGICLLSLQRLWAAQRHDLCRLPLWWYSYELRTNILNVIQTLQGRPVAHIHTHTHTYL